MTLQTARSFHERSSEGPYLSTLSATKWPSFVEHEGSSHEACPETPGKYEFFDLRGFVSLKGRPFSTKAPQGIGPRAGRIPNPPGRIQIKERPIDVSPQN
jgi:hypothetical protein